MNPVRTSSSLTTGTAGSLTSSESDKSSSSASVPEQDDLTWPQFLQQYALGHFDPDKPPRRPTSSPPFKQSFLPAPVPPVEIEALRRRSLYKYRWFLNRSQPLEFTRIQDLCKRFFNAEHIILTWVLEDESMFKTEASTYCVTERKNSLCSHSILRNEDVGMIIHDTHKDWRFKNNPNVLNDPFVRFYASANIITPDGYCIGSLCVMDSHARTDFTRQDSEALLTFATMVLTELDAWVFQKELEERDKREEALSEFTRAALADPQMKLQDSFALACSLIARGLDLDCVTILNITRQDMQHKVTAQGPQKKRDKVISSNLEGLVDSAVDVDCPGTSALIYSTMGSMSGLDFRYGEGEGHEVPDFVRHLGFVASMAVLVKTDSSPLPAADTEVGILVAFSKDPRRLFPASDLHFLQAFSTHIATISFRARADQAAMAKIAFVSSISHELRTPLHGLLGVSDLLALTALTTTQEAFVNTIDSCGKSLLGIINNVLDVAKQSSESNKDSLKASRVDLFDLLQQAMDSVAATSHPNVELIMDVCLSSDWRFVETDPNSIRQILMNLLGNALKFTDEGSVELHVSLVDTGPTSASPRSGPRLVRFAVTDTGCGISETFLPNIFTKPFAQENPLKQGTGLGLILTRFMVGRLGGTLQLETKEGVGTKLWMDVELYNSGRQASFILPERPCRINVTSKKLTGVLENMLAVNGMKVHPGLDGVCDGDIVIVDRESDELINLLGNSKAVASQIIYLSSIAQHSRTVDFLNLRLERKDVAVMVLTTPVGPLKLFEAMERLQDRNLARSCSAVACLITRERVMLTQRSTPDLLSLESVAEPTITHADSLPAIAITTPANEPQSSLAASASAITFADLPIDEQPIPTQPQPNNKLHCLLAEDNVTNRMILSQFLKKMGISYLAANDGQQAFDMYAASNYPPIDFVLMDIQMPVMDGLKSARAIRQFEVEQGRKKTRIWALTGLDTKEDQAAAFEAGVDGYLTKPIGLKDLTNVLGKVYGTKVAGWSPPTNN
ncbi:hypothetical protein PhCBS80983_g03854 [Powellomyces hirtus]|uniref:Histidine kinase n=1 Tax=Powellomyces hirtus TaxID=109895 RepID=A0A507E048_9FUNG|nr:hypothetical protein PhCBS80983_g03854 [Powellomyces hirtus]